MAPPLTMVYMSCPVYYHEMSCADSTYMETPAYSYMFICKYNTFNYVGTLYSKCSTVRAIGIGIMNNRHLLPHTHVVLPPDLSLEISTVIYQAPDDQHQANHMQQRTCIACTQWHSLGMVQYYTLLNLSLYTTGVK